MGAEGNKKPRAVVGAGFFGNLQVIFYSPGNMPSARTSVGNKEYEYEADEEHAADLPQAVDRRETVHFGGAARAVALRHGSTLSDAGTPCQQKSSPEKPGGNRNSVWTAMRLNRYG
jgi:hypothetical protein